MADLFEHLVGDAGIPSGVCTLDLYIDGRRQPEVQSLGFNVGREKVERNAWILPRQPITESAHIIRGRMMLRFEGNQDVSVRCAGSPRGVIHVVDVAVGKAYVVENVVHLGGRNPLTNAALNQIHQTRGFFNTGSCLRAHMQNKLAAVGGREKILAKKRNQSPGKKADNNKAWNEGEPNRNELCQQRGVGRANSLKEPLKTSLKASEDISRRRAAMLVSL